jgi:hypothetical protein
MRVTNGIPLGCSLLLPVGTVELQSGVLLGFHNAVKVKFFDLGITRDTILYYARVSRF